MSAWDNTGVLKRKKVKDRRIKKDCFAALAMTLELLSVAKDLFVCLFVCLDSLDQTPFKS